LTKPVSDDSDDWIPTFRGPPTVGGMQASSSSPGMDGNGDGSLSHHSTVTAGANENRPAAVSWKLDSMPQYYERPDTRRSARSTRESAAQARANGVALPDDPPAFGIIPEVPVHDHRGMNRFALLARLETAVDIGSSSVAPEPVIPLRVAEPGGWNVPGWMRADGLGA